VFSTPQPNFTTETPKTQESPVQKRDFLQTLQKIADGQKRERIFPETNRLPGAIEPPPGATAECDFCGQTKPEDELEPEEAGMKACWDCLADWRKTEQEKKPVKNAKEKKCI
jgi:hypothetical protein